MLLLISYPLMPTALLLQVLSEEGAVLSIDATINDVIIAFVRGSEGGFITETANHIDKSYLAYIVRQLNRMFAN